ncbi:MAG: aldehyde dehydrogenase (NADP(+)) [Novosphingobium sp.]
MISGAILIGGVAREGKNRFRAINPASGELLEQDYFEATQDDVADACTLAEQASESFAELSPIARAEFLEAIAEAILAIGEPLIETAMAETGLPRVRLEGERMRTVNQLRMFGSELRRGEWLDVTIDLAIPERIPPRSDLRRMNWPVGPVAVFGASNFPLAFSVAGGDTASALAAGCPVVVKGHPAHPGTGEHVARAICDAVRATGLPGGVFSYLPGSEHALGGALVADPRIKAAGFTGSRVGGLALAEIAARRPEPIPVFAEMSSINPVLLLPAALEAKAEALGAAFVGSLTMGAGQFCTNPGLVIAVESPALDRFVAAATEVIRAIEPQVMLTPGIHRAYESGIAALEGHKATRHVAGVAEADAPNRCSASLFATTGSEFLASAELGNEVFGSASLIVRCRDLQELLAVVEGVEGQLTATLHADSGDAGLAARLMPILRRKVGRILANGWPTGVEVCPAMVHGGPFPSTTDARTTSVGTLAMTRFLRPVCYQDIPDELLPVPLQSTNPWELPRRIDAGT